MNKYKKRRAYAEKEYSYCFSSKERCDFRGKECRNIIDRKTSKDLLDICTSEKVIFKKVRK